MDNVINFEPQQSQYDPRKARPTSRTSLIINMILRRNGATLSDITSAVNKVKGKKLTERQIATQWLVPSYIATRGFGVVTHKSPDSTLRIYGYEYGEKPPFCGKTKIKVKPIDG